MREHDGLGPWPASQLQLGDIDVQRPEMDIDKDWNSPILNDGSNRCGKSCSDGDDFVPSFYFPLPQLVGGQGHKCQQIGR